MIYRIFLRYQLLLKLNWVTCLTFATLGYQSLKAQESSNSSMAPTPMMDIIEDNIFDSFIYSEEQSRPIIYEPRTTTLTAMNFPTSTSETTPLISSGNRSTSPLHNTPTTTSETGAIEETTVTQVSPEASTSSIRQPRMTYRLGPFTFQPTPNAGRQVIQFFANWNDRGYHFDRQIRDYTSKKNAPNVSADECAMYEHLIALFKKAKEYHYSTIQHIQKKEKSDSSKEAATRAFEGDLKRIELSDERNKIESCIPLIERNYKKLNKEREELKTLNNNNNQTRQINILQQKIDWRKEVIQALSDSIDCLLPEDERKDSQILQTAEWKLALHEYFKSKALLFEEKIRNENCLHEYFYDSPEIDRMIDLLNTAIAQIKKDQPQGKTLPLYREIASCLDNDSSLRHGEENIPKYSTHVHSLLTEIKMIADDQLPRITPILAKAAEYFVNEANEAKQGKMYKQKEALTNVFEAFRKATIAAEKGEQQGRVIDLLINITTWNDQAIAILNENNKTKAKYFEKIVTTLTNAVTEAQKETPDESIIADLMTQANQSIEEINTLFAINSTLDTLHSITPHTAYLLQEPPYALINTNSEEKTEPESSSYQADILSNFLTKPALGYSKELLDQRTEQTQAQIKKGEEQLTIYEKELKEYQNKLEQLKPESLPSDEALHLHLQQLIAKLEQAILLQSRLIEELKKSEKYVHFFHYIKNMIAAEAMSGNPPYRVEYGDCFPNQMLTEYNQNKMAIVMAECELRGEDMFRQAFIAKSAGHKNEEEMFAQAGIALFAAITEAQKKNPEKRTIVSLTEIATFAQQAALALGEGNDEKAEDLMKKVPQL